MPLVKRTPMALEIDCRDLTNRVCFWRGLLVDCAPGLAERVRNGKREARWIGGTIPNVVRKPYGPGWALVGDAGLNVAPCTAAGISDAFRDAEFLVEAIDEGFSGRRPLDDALADYERRRNEVALPIYELACENAPFAPPPPELVTLFNALRGNQPEINRFIGLFAQTVSVPEFFAPENIQHIIGAASHADTEEKGRSAPIASFTAASGPLYRRRRA